MRQPFPQVSGLAHVQHHVGPIPHQVNAGAFWRLPEKFLAQALDQGPRIGEKEHLRHGFVTISSSSSLRQALNPKWVSDLPSPRLIGVVG
jgi:hypothetical protein